MKTTIMKIPGNNPPIPIMNKGLTLIELLVAIALGAILMTGAIQLFVNNRVTYELTTDMSRLQENARFALQAMVTDIRMAGHIGCHNNFKIVHNNTPFIAGELADPTHAIEGFNAGALAWSPSGNLGLTSPVANFIGNSDAITVRYLVSPFSDSDGNGIFDLALTNNVGDFNTAINIDNSNTFAFQQGEVATISDCASTDVFTINVVGANSITANSLSGSPATGSRERYAPDTRPLLGRFVAARYFLRLNDELTPSLYRVSFATTPANARSTELLWANQEELVDGVRSMQILYGVDTAASDDGIPDQYLAAGAAGLTTRDEWLNVISVRIALLMETVDAISKLPDPNTYQVGDVSFCGPAAPVPCDVLLPADNRRRRVFQTTILVRNNRCRLGKKTECPPT